ncbi:hypothetical protein Vretimale_18213 [Volvox reticuliferus]|uniref:Uncharacterized protein n=1 Tax=Volvox reticuliferus TaxID=1737510 RepID=A0A8J4LYQ3_9CHLO|nr:hypothetical protein Vretimale_18213 [Volvox reticuliferus]
MVHTSHTLTSHTLTLQSWMLSGSCLIIVLVDKRKLDPWLAAADLCLPALCGMELGYTGHYVLLVGYEAASQEYVVRDPAAERPDLRVSGAALDAARRSFGTDEDILVVSNSSIGGSGGGGGGGVVQGGALVYPPAAPRGRGSGGSAVAAAGVLCVATGHGGPAGKEGHLSGLGFSAVTHTGAGGPCRA